MELALQILLGAVTLICFAGGLNLLIKGAGSFLPATVSPQPVLDNITLINYNKNQMSRK